ncbi:hypothetical protein FOXYSP1_20011 [Fusarium oxysporum f. sp. phaseoli]
MEGSQIYTCWVPSRRRDIRSSALQMYNSTKRLGRQNS